jgi:hypothetical protein
MSPPLALTALWQPQGEAGREAVAWQPPVSAAWRRRVLR